MNPELLVASSVFSASATVPVFLMPLTRQPLSPAPLAVLQGGKRDDNDQEFALELDAQLQRLSVRSYERLIAHLLRASGYEDVKILRDHRVKRRSHKGRTKHGGVDITAKIKAEFGVTTVLVQVKQYKRPVSRRFVDELRGALLRTQARQGLLITTSHFAPGARKAALEDHIGPVHLIDGTHLRDLLINYRLGVKRDKRGGWRLHPRFFRRLDKMPDEEHAAR